VLPLIPSYLCILGGAPLSDASGTGGEYRPRLIIQTAGFILGFSAVFITLSVVFAAAFTLMGGVSRYINWISGGLVIVLGLNIIFDFIRFLNYEKRFHLAHSPRGIIGAFTVGAAFGAGWTPCVGPVLGGILLLAAQSGGIPRAVLYLVFYSAGLGLPFLGASLFFSFFVKASAKLRSHLPLIRRISGVLMVCIGVLIITGRFQALNALAARWQNKISGGQAAEKSAASQDMSVLRETAGNKSGAADGRGLPGELIKALEAAGFQAAKQTIDPPDFTLPLLGGSAQSLSSLKGKVLLLNFWATWCGPCRTEMPSMETLYRRLKGKGFELLAVNIGEKSGTVSAFMKSYDYSFPTALDEKGSVASQYGAQAIPASYILDRQGRIVARVIGAFDWDKPQVTSVIEDLLMEQ
jgi:cytochrome c-type biogenesis protein